MAKKIKFDISDIEKQNDSELTKSVKDFYSGAKKYAQSSTKLKQLGLAYAYVLFYRNLPKGSKKSLFVINKTAKATAYKITGNEENASTKRLQQKLVRSFRVMCQNHVYPKDSFDFIKKNTIKNLYNGNTLKDIKRKEKLKQEKANKVKSSKKDKPSDVIVDVLKKQNFSCSNFIILCRRKKVLYIPMQDISHKIVEKLKEYDGIDINISQSENDEN